MDFFPFYVGDRAVASFGYIWPQLDETTRYSLHTFMQEQANQLRCPIIRQFNRTLKKNVSYGVSLYCPSIKKWKNNGKEIILTGYVPEIRNDEHGNPCLYFVFSYSIMQNGKEVLSYSPKTIQLK